jgi:hypothetical protein
MKRITSILSAATLTLVGVFTAAPSAQATDCTVIESTKVSNVTIYASTPSQAKASVTARDTCEEISYVGADAYLSDGDFATSLFEQNQSGDTYQLESGYSFDKYSAAGRGKMIFDVWGTTVKYTEKPFYVRRNVYFSKHNAMPEPVAKGSPIKVYGSVKRLSVNSLGQASYVPYKGHLMRYYFRAKGTSTYVLKGENYTNSYGNFSKSFTASVDGYWYARSTQTTVNAGANGTPDFVDVA